MSTIDQYRLMYVAEIPARKEVGILYVSRQYKVAVHLCACGCGNKAVTPLNKSQWSLSTRANVPSLWPSIGNWGFPCRSHYVIEAGRVRWASTWSQGVVRWSSPGWWCSAVSFGLMG